MKAFTPVCTTEIIGFAKANTYFKKLNTELIGLSIDSNASHLAWLNDIFEKTGTYVPFPIIADRNGEIARKYGTDFLRASDYVESSEEDQEHMNANSHQIFASVIAEHLQSI